MSRCPYCAKLLPTGKSVRQHVAASQSCSKSWEMHQLAKRPKKRQKKSPSPSTPHSDIDHIHDEEEMDDLSHEFILPHDAPEPADTRAPNPAVDPPVTGNKRAWVEDAEDDDDQPNSQTRYSEAYPHSAGQPLRKEKTEFEKFRDNDSAGSRQPWEPFSSKKEWELATWLIKNANQRATDEFLKLPIVSVHSSARL